MSAFPILKALKPKTPKAKKLFRTLNPRAAAGKEQVVARPRQSTSKKSHLEGDGRDEQAAPGAMTLRGMYRVAGDVQGQLAAAGPDEAAKAM